ncbi:3807_t:CDS:2, partial [Scutellospora calospora]
MADDPWDDWEAAADAGLEPKPAGTTDDHEKNKQIWQEANSYLQPEITRTDSTRTEYVPQLRILKRPKNPGSTTTTHPSHLPITLNSNVTFTSDSGSFSINSKQTKSLADREAEYIAARQKIFGHSDDVENNNGNSGDRITGDGDESKTQKGRVIEDNHLSISVSNDTEDPEVGDWLVLDRFNPNEVDGMEGDSVPIFDNVGSDDDAIVLILVILTIRLNPSRIGLKSIYLKRPEM